MCAIIGCDRELSLDFLMQLVVLMSSCVIVTYRRRRFVSIGVRRMLNLFFRLCFLVCLFFVAEERSVVTARRKSRTVQELGGQMGGDLFPASPANLPEDDLFVDDFEHFGELPESTSNSRQGFSWVEADDLKLMHRIGRGLFGDTWLATLHNSTEEFDEFHEVAVKMLPLVADHQVRSVSKKFENMFQASEGLKGVSWPRGISTKGGKACIVLKFYEGSVGDKMARLPGNRLPVADVLRYGADVARGVVELHSCGLMALNLKPCNFLLDDQDVAVVGEFGLPLLFFEKTASTSESVPWLGTPHYMAPEQWDPASRGPISYETDSWGFGCSILEMVSGTRPWDSMTADEIFNAVVVKRQKPVVPNGLPTAIEKVLRHCFEYDYRGRPNFKQILRSFLSPEDPFKQGDWVCVRDNPAGPCSRICIVKNVANPDTVLLQYCEKPGEPVEFSISSRLCIWKNALRVGDRIRIKQSVISPRFGWPGGSHESEGYVSEIGEQDGVMLVKFGGSQEAWRADPVELERVSSGFVAGDWVRLRRGWSSEGLTGLRFGQRPSRIGLVHQVDHDGSLLVAFFGRETLWTGQPRDLEKVQPLSVGEFVRLKDDVVNPRFHWPTKDKTGRDTGRISSILPNGCLILDFPGRFWNRKGWWADSEEVVVVRMNEIDGLVEKYQHVESMHWAIRPVLSLLGLLLAARAGIVVVKVVTHPFSGTKRAKNDPAKKESQVPVDNQGPVKDSQTAGNTAWLPPHVATLIFGEGNSVPSR